MAAADKSADAGSNGSSMFTPAHGRDNGFPPDLPRLDPKQGLLFELNTARAMIREAVVPGGTRPTDYALLTGRLASVLDNAVMFAAWLLEPGQQPGQEQHTGAGFTL
jgi:hypothetical protein